MNKEVDENKTVANKGDFSFGANLIVVGILLVASVFYFQHISDNYIIGVVGLWAGIYLGTILVGYGATSQIASKTYSSNLFNQKLLFLYKFLCLSVLIIAPLADLSARPEAMFLPGLSLVICFGFLTPVFWVILLISNAKSGKSNRNTEALPPEEIGARNKV